MNTDMQTKDFQNRSLLQIFLSYFKPHLRLFLLDMSCAFTVAAIDLAFPLVTRGALYQLLPEKRYHQPVKILLHYPRNISE